MRGAEGAPLGCPGLGATPGATWVLSTATSATAAEAAPQPAASSLGLKTSPLHSLKNTHLKIFQ